MLGVVRKGMLRFERMGLLGDLRAACRTLVAYHHDDHENDNDDDSKSDQP